MPWPLLGLDGITDSLAQMISARRLPHALLFVSPPGGGKNALARALAAALNCEAPDTVDRGPCGLCSACRKIERDIYPDLITLVPEGKARQIKMESVQALRDQMAFRPFEGRVKVFIIREVQRLNQDSGNALLKTLEEPPPDSHLILTTPQEGAVMATIVSRCLCLRLPPVPRELIMEVLACEGKLNEEQARLMAALSGGALGDALHEDGVATWESWKALDNILYARGPSRLESAWVWIKEAVADENQARLLTLLRLWWRETVRLAVAGPSGLEGPAPSEAQTRWAGYMTPKKLQKLSAALNQLEDSLNRPAVKSELAFENFWLKVFQLDT